MKSKIFLWLTSCLALTLVSCLGDNAWDNVPYEVDKNCQILSFSVESDSLPALTDVRFTIDQINEQIMNLDSMDFGTVIEDKVIATISTGEYVSKIQMISQATGDTLDWESGDSLDISQPVQILIYNAGGTIQRTYDMWVNIHQMVPDSMVWKQHTAQALGENVAEEKVIQYADAYYMYVQSSANEGYRLYTSAINDAITWNEASLAGLPSNGLRLSQLSFFGDTLYVPGENGTLYQTTDAHNWSLVENTPFVHAVLGGMKESVDQPAVLAAIVNDNNELKFASMNKTGEWSIGASVPENFPVEGYAALPVSLMYRERIMLAGGKTENGALVNSVWATMDALTWSEQTDAYGSHLFSKRQGSSIAYYDEMYYLIGGIGENNQPLKDIYRSSDYGVTWNYIDSLIVLPMNYQARGFASLLVDPDNYLMIFGGKSSEKGNVIGDIWRGRINRLGFERQ